MSLTKRRLDEINEQNSPAKCPDCRIDWEIKDYVLCKKHQREFEIEQSRYYHEEEEY